MRNRYKRGFFTLLGLVLAMVIICILGYMLFTVYFRRPISQEEVKELLPEQSSGSPNYQTILDSSREQIKDISKQHLNQLKQLEDF